MQEDSREVWIEAGGRICLVVVDAGGGGRGRGQVRVGVCMAKGLGVDGFVALGEGRI